MSLSSSLFSGISGLSTLGNSMTVIGDNIANVNTVGFKASRVTFQDVLSQTVATTGGGAQVGRGTALSDISSSFAQGSFESTDCTTDLAIGGEGFFVVRDPNNEENQYYTRAGEFRFDKDGNFTNPSSHIIRGWKLNGDTGEDEGSITDIKLGSFTSSPKETTMINAITNLDADSPSNSGDLAAAWNGADPNDEYIGDNAYEYQTTLKVYDSLGSTHDVTIYYDKGTTDSTYEFIVTCSPGEDARSCVSAGEAGLGMLGKGVVTFNDGSGVIEDINFSRFIGDDGGLAVTTDWTLGGGSTTTVTGEWDGAAPPATYTFTNLAGAVTLDETNAAFDVTIGGSGSGMLTIPANYSGQVLQGPDGIQVSFSTDPLGTIAIANNAVLTVDVTAGDPNVLGDTNSWAAMTETHDLINGYFTFDADFLGGTTTPTVMNIQLDFGAAFNSTTNTWTNDSLATTQYSSASNTTFQSSDGYGAGALQSITVGTDGAITGQYSNGQVIPLYRVALAKFQNTQGLYKEGGNLFSETRLSGDPITSKPGSNGLGLLSPNSLEQSNVDIAQEFVKMITTQRGFQANSKIITVTDQMLAELIQLKSR